MTTEVVKSNTIGYSKNAIEISMEDTTGYTHRRTIVITMIVFIFLFLYIMATLIVYQKARSDAVLQDKQHLNSPPLSPLGDMSQTDESMMPSPSRMQNTISVTPAPRVSPIILKTPTPIATPTPTRPQNLQPTPTGIPEIYACDPGGVCGIYTNTKEKGCPITFQDRNCSNKCSQIENRCKI